MSERVLEATGLRRSFAGVRAVDDVSLTVDAGEIVALIGPNGAGKTTTFNLINGQLRPDAGRVRLRTADVTGLPPRRLAHLGIARTFQITATFLSMTALENVSVALAARERWSLAALVDGRLNRDRALALLGEVGMAAAAERPCSMLAYGDLKRVELAMALAAAPRLLLMDEPTAGMAPKERGQLMRLVAGIARERRTAVLFTEHDMDVVFAHADRILVMSQGVLIADGRPEEIRAHPKVREVYLGSSAPG
ncbi:MAG: ABC transporter ATP-binding protein [Hyphomicrobiaceae bacterium]